MLMKQADLDPREYPAIHIHWQGCGDSGGIEDINPMTPLGLEYSRKHNAEPQSMDYTTHKPVVHFAQVSRPYTHDPLRTYTQRITLTDFRRGDYDLDKWVYDNWGVCEINEGGYAHVFVDMATRKVWGESHDWITEDRLNLSINYED